MTPVRPRPPKPSCPKRLLVEGKDDMYAIVALLERHGVRFNDGPYVHVAESVDQVLAAIPVDVKSYPCLGVVLDADLDLAARWQALRDRLAAAAVQAPENRHRKATLVGVISRITGSAPGSCRITVRLVCSRTSSPC